MKLDAVGYFSCIRCGSSLVLEEGYTMGVEQNRHEVIGGKLSCQDCSWQYAIQQGVPCFMDESRSSAVDLSTGRSFAMAWKEFSRLDDRYRQQFFDWIFPVDGAFFYDKVVLEGGCGKGRHAKIVSECGARQVFAVDIGAAVEIAFQNVGHLPGVNIVQSDIGNLPFGRIFDFAFSLGVLHHMESPVGGFRCLVEKLKPDGAIVAWVYGRENNWWLIRIVNPIRVSLTSKFAPGALKLLSGVLAVPVFLWSRLIAAPWTALRKKNPWLPALYYGDYLSYISRFDFVEIHHIVFDHLVAPVANYVAEGYFRAWFAESGLKNPVIRWHNRNSWTGFASFKPDDLQHMHERAGTGALPSAPTDSLR